MSKLLALFIFSSIFTFNFYSSDSLSEGFSATAAPTATLTPNDTNGSFSMKLSNLAEIDYTI